MKGKAEAGKAKIKNLVSFLPGAKGFRGGGESHRVWVEKTGDHQVMVASTPTLASVLLDRYVAEIAQFPADTETEIARCRALQQRVEVARTRYAAVANEVNLLNNVTDLVAGRSAVNKRQERFADSLVELMNAVHEHRMRLASQVPPAMRPGGKTTYGDVRCVATFTVVDKQAWKAQANGGPAGTVGPTARTTERDPRNAYPIDPSESRVTGQIGGFALEGGQVSARGNSVQNSSRARSARVRPPRTPRRSCCGRSKRWWRRIRPGRSGCEASRSTFRRVPARAVQVC